MDVILGHVAFPGIRRAMLGDRVESPVGQVEIKAVFLTFVANLSQSGVGYRCQMLLILVPRPVCGLPVYPMVSPSDCGRSRWYRSRRGGGVMTSDKPLYSPQGILIRQRLRVMSVIPLIVLQNDFARASQQH